MIPQVNIGRKKNKPVQYVVGGVIAVIILGFWISMPLMNNSSFSSSVTAGNPFNSRVANIATLGGSDVASEGGAAGGAMSGEMINNPATSGEEILSSLFQSGASDETGTEAAAAPADASADAPSVGGPGSGSGGDSSPAPSPRPGGKLAPAASIGGTSGGSMTAGAASNHGKFFGTGGSQRPDFAALGGGPDLKKIAEEPGKKNVSTSLLNTAAEKSKTALKTDDLASQRGSASAAFTGGGKNAMADLAKNVEKSGDAVTGLNDGASTTGNLKKSDPSISKRKVTPPAVNSAKEEQSKDPNEELKQMLIKMLMQSAMGMIFGGKQRR